MTRKTRRMKTRRRKVWLSRLLPHPRTRASQRKKHLVKMKTQVTLMGKFMKKRGYGARKRRDHNKEFGKICYKCKNPDHVVADCPYNSDNDEDEKKHKEKKEKKENKEKKMTF